MQEKEELRRGDGLPLALEPLKEAYSFISLCLFMASFTVPPAGW